MLKPPCRFASAREARGTLRVLIRPVSDFDLRLASEHGLRTKWGAIVTQVTTPGTFRKHANI